MMEHFWHIVEHAGSIASILGCLLAVYIMWHERTIEREVHTLKGEEEKWHEQGKPIS
jgi:hypothetical protein